MLIQRKFGVVISVNSADIMERQTHTIDATDIPLGRLATRIAILLQGKDRPDYAPNKDSEGFVVVKNFDRVRFTGKKFKDKIYYHHTGYIGGLKETSLKDVFEKDPAKVLQMAVLGMLPKNKLRAKRINRLTIEQ